MSIVIVGGNERMENSYKEICESYGCTAKVFTKEKSSIWYVIFCCSNHISMVDRLTTISGDDRAGAGRRGRDDQGRDQALPG